MGAIDDPRVRFHNLEHNVGEQSGPNNSGIRLARGRYIAFLNHDDLWLPDHLELAVDQLERTGTDMVYGLVDHVAPAGPVVLLGASASGHYEFVGLLDDEGFRRELSDVTRATADESAVFAQVAQLGSELEAGLLALLFETKPLSKLVRDYAIF